MKLLAINHGDKNTKPSFKGVEHFDYIKRLDGMVCAVCGRKALLTDIFIKTHTQNCKPLIYNMQRNALSYIEQNFPQVWALLLSYTKKFPEQPLDTIMEDSKNYIELKQAISSHFSKKKSDVNTMFFTKMRHGLCANGRKVCYRKNYPCEQFFCSLY